MINRDNQLYFSIAEKLAGVDAYEGVFLASYGAWLMAMLLSSTFFAASISATLLMVIRYVGIVGAVLALFLRGDHRATEALSLFLIVLITYITTKTNAPAFLDLVVLIYCGRFTNFKKIARESLWLTGFLLVITVLSARAGIIENYISQDLDRGELRRREYLGFLYALQPAQLMFNITCLVIFLNDEGLSIPSAIILLVANLFIFMATDGRLSFYISVVLIVITFLLKWNTVKKTFGRFLTFSAPFIFVICFIFCWLATAAYSGSNPVFHELNSILGNRLSLGNRALSEYGTTLFGQSIDFVGNGLGVNGKLNKSGIYNYVDCLYIRLPILYGWVFTALFLFGMTISTIWAAKKRNYSLVFIFAMIAAHCVIDDLVIRLQFCTFLFLIGSDLVEVVNRAVVCEEFGRGGDSVN